MKIIKLTAVRLNNAQIRIPIKRIICYVRDGSETKVYVDGFYRDGNTCFSYVRETPDEIDKLIQGA